MVEDTIKNKPVENIFRITDEIVHQLNKTKKMIILMIISIVVVLPVTHIITFTLSETRSFSGAVKVAHHGLTDLAVLQKLLHLE
ncbi:MAG: hypothetical protein ACJ70T_07600 [Nitrososphaera sp.]